MSLIYDFKKIWRSVLSSCRRHFFFIKCWIHSNWLHHLNMLRWTAHPTVWHYQCHNFGVKTAYPIRVGRRVGHILNARVASSSHSIAVLSIARTGPGTEFIDWSWSLTRNTWSWSRALIVSWCTACWRKNWIEKLRNYHRHQQQIQNLRKCFNICILPGCRKSCTRMFRSQGRPST